MSLVICANEVKQNTGDSIFQAPYSFSNHLQQPLRIPANSEIAVQSLKVVKDGTISLSPSTAWYQYYGVRLATGTIDLAKTTSAPIQTDLGIVSSTAASIESTAELIQGGVNRGVPNPESYGLNRVEVFRDTEDLFTGFKYTMDSRTNASTLNVKPTSWVDTSTQGGLVYNSASNTLTASGAAVTTANPFNIAIGTNNPMALNNGEYIMDISNAENAAWAIGLTRSQVTGKPDYLSLAGAEATRNQNLFGDFVVGAFATTTGTRYFRAYHAVYDTTAAYYTTDNPLAMRSVDYASGDGSFNAEYNWSTNNGLYTKVRMTTVNEFVTVDFWESAKSIWVPFITSTGAKGTVYKPVADTCRALYPLAFISANRGNSGGVVSPRFLTVEKFGGRSIGMVYGTTDWWGYLARNDLEILYGKEVDVRPYNDMGTATAHTYKGVNASGYLQDYEHVIIALPDTETEPTYGDTRRANADLILGFKGQNVIDTYTTDTLSGGIFESTTIPSLVSTTSLFVRLNSFNITTYNAGRSAFSQIIYSVPRFSTGTSENVGSLFFESPEKTYVSLNNPSEIVANTFSIDLVNEDETLANDLLGKTIVILHIRKSLV